jgi:kynurenine 3-monooxygenase
MALSYRGIAALKKAGLFDKIQPLLIPMEGRCVHPLNGAVNFQPYGHKGQVI